MRILDRQRYWSFLKAYIICFVALVGLYVVIDAFSNLDEFTERTSGTSELLGVMGRYYLVRTSLFYDRLCGVIAMMAAIFTVTWMQKSNELIAMLSAGIGTHRVIRPVLIGAVAVSGLAMLNQELVLAQLGEELQRPADDDGVRLLKANSATDSNRVVLTGALGLRESPTILSFAANVPVELAGGLVDLSAAQARHVPVDHPTAPLKGGWLLHRARLLPGDQPIEGKLAEVLVRIPPEGHAAWPAPVPVPAEASRSREPSTTSGSETFFLRSSVTFSTLTRGPQWYNFASTPELFAALIDPTTIERDRAAIAVYLHGRALRPLLGLALLAVSLPLVLGGENRNMFINLGLSLGVSALYYAAVFVAQYLGNEAVYPPEMAAWAPLIGFGTLAVAGWDRIRT